MNVSNCCGAPPKGASEDMGLCPKCHEGCLYVCEDCEQEVCTCCSAGETQSDLYAVAIDHEHTDRINSIYGTEADT